MECAILSYFNHSGVVGVDVVDNEEMLEKRRVKTFRN
jgi:hypothetical protein